MSHNQEIKNIEMTKNAIMISNYDYDFESNNMESSVNVTLRGGSTIR